jgi:hypothetical protein
VRSIRNHQDSNSAAATKKLRGRSSRPLGRCSCLLQFLVFLFLCSFLFGCHGSILPFPFFMEFRNDVLLQLVECIESSQNEVKRKMIERETRNAAPKSRVWVDRKKNSPTRFFVRRQSPVVSHWQSPANDQRRTTNDPPHASIMKGKSAFAGAQSWPLQTMQ